MQRLGRNHGAYHGDSIPIDTVLRDILSHAHRHGWQSESLDASPSGTIPVLTRAPRSPSPWAPRLYLSTGIHGDEPAGPLAVRQLLAEDAFPPGAWLWLCPCLNPSGFARNTREAASGHDLNRDYRHRQTPEVRAHIAWLEKLPLFDLAVCVHEDWEAAGFYLYELNPENHPSLARPILDAVADVCPIDLSPVIDGRDAHQGLIRPSLDPVTRTEWPEAFYLLQHKTRLSYTLEAPSDFALPVRVAALTTAIRTALAACQPPHPPPTASEPPQRPPGDCTR